MRDYKGVLYAVLTYIRHWPKQRERNSKVLDTSITARSNNNIQGSYLWSNPGQRRCTDLHCQHHETRHTLGVARKLLIQPLPIRTRGRGTEWAPEWRQHSASPACLAGLGLFRRSRAFTISLNRYIVKEFLAIKKRIQVAPASPHQPTSPHPLDAVLYRRPADPSSSMLL